MQLADFFTRQAVSLGRCACLQLAVQPHEIVVGRVLSDPAADLRAGFQVPQLDAFVLEAPDEARGEDVVLPAAAARHALLDAAPAQVVPETARSVLSPLSLCKTVGQP